MLTAEQKARLKELKNKSELTDEEKAEVAELNKLESGKTFTQDEVNGLITKESRKAVEKILKDMGVEDVKNAKEGLAKLKELQDKDKTELEKAQSTIAELTGQIETLTGTAGEYEAKIAILGAGVKGEDLEKYTKLYKITDGETPEERIEAVLKDFPLSTGNDGGNGGNPPPDLGDKTGGGGKDNSIDELQAKMDEIAGIKQQS